jgi:hypothetical protein
MPFNAASAKDMRMSRDLQSHMTQMALGRETAGRFGAGFTVHHNNVRTSLTAALATAFPALKRTVGETRFNEVAGRFVVAAPPCAPQLSAYGAEFPAFLAGQDVPPYAGDVARLEWARVESYFAADAPALDIHRLLSAQASDMDRVTFTPHPATRWITSAFSVFSIWQGEAKDTNRPQCAAITRKGHHIITREINIADAVFLGALASGAPLKEAVVSARIPEHALQDILQAHFINATFKENGDA